MPVSWRETIVSRLDVSRIDTCVGRKIALQTEISNKTNLTIDLSGPDDNTSDVNMDEQETAALAAAVRKLCFLCLF